MNKKINFTPPPPQLQTSGANPIPLRTELGERNKSFSVLRKFIKSLMPDVFLEEIWTQKKRFTKEKLKKRRTLLFQVPVCEHCNLNCKGCCAFSPLASEKYLDPVSYEKDCARLSELSGGIVEHIDLLGGEPLLHPEIIKIIEITRKNFTGPVSIITNGIKLAAMSGEFWTACHKNNITIVITGYPIKIDYEKINSLGMKNNVLIEMRGSKHNKLHMWTKSPYDLQGKQNAYDNFLRCLPSNFCVMLKNGKIATCNQVFFAEHFNKYFNKNIEITDDNFIDIYKASSFDEIQEFVSRPIPFCKYCNIKNIKRGIKWETSKKEITEWT